MSTTGFAQTPEPPYYAVIFTSKRTDADRGYDHMAARMVELAATMPGFLGVESVRGADGLVDWVLRSPTGALSRISSIGKQTRSIRWRKQRASRSGMRTMPCGWPRWSGLMGSDGAVPAGLLRGLVF